MNKPQAVRVVLYGASGRMGTAIARQLERDALTSIGGSVRRDAANNELIAYDADGQRVDMSSLLQSADVAIDFSLPEAVEKHVELCAQNSLPYVCGVTGLSESTLAVFSRWSQQLPLLWAPNMSTAVTVCFGAASDIAARLPAGFSVLINDIHHAGKQDAPSGTALEFGRLIQAASAEPVDIQYESVREGRHPGEHHIMFTTGSDLIELRHRAGTRDEFAVGAVRAARWLSEQSAGLYNMRNVLGITSSS